MPLTFEEQEPTPRADIPREETTPPQNPEQETPNEASEHATSDAPPSNEQSSDEEVSNNQTSDDQAPGYYRITSSAESIHSWKSFQQGIRPDFVTLFNAMSRHRRVLRDVWYPRAARSLLPTWKYIYDAIRINCISLYGTVSALRIVIEFDSNVGLIPFCSFIQGEYDRAAKTWREVGDDMMDLILVMTMHRDPEVHGHGRKLHRLWLRFDTWWYNVELVLDDVVGQLRRIKQYEEGDFDQDDLDFQDESSDDGFMEGLESSQAELQPLLQPLAPGSGTEERVDQVQEREYSEQSSGDEDAEASRGNKRRCLDLNRWAPAIQLR